MGKILKSKWKCDECGEIHDHEEAALECCPPEISEGFTCPLCAEWHREESAALDCCGYEENSPPPPPSAAELEAAGQLRLPL